jgi:hypothetical protein
MLRGPARCSSSAARTLQVAVRCRLALQQRCELQCSRPSLQRCEELQCSVAARHRRSGGWALHVRFSSDVYRIFVRLSSNVRPTFVRRPSNCRPTFVERPSNFHPSNFRPTSGLHHCWHHRPASLLTSSACVRADIIVPTSCLRHCGCHRPTSCLCHPQVVLCPIILSTWRHVPCYLVNLTSCAHVLSPWRLTWYRTVVLCSIHCGRASCGLVSCSLSCCILPYYCPAIREIQTIHCVKIL